MTRIGDMAYVPGVRFNLFALHAVVTKCPVTVDNEGVHILGGSVPFVRRESGPYCFATRITDPRIAKAVLVPGRQRCISINDLHVALVHSHAETLRETARQRGVKVVGELVPCAGCSAAKGRRMPVPRSTNSRSANALERLVIDLSEKRSTSSSDHHYRLMIVDGFSRFGWTYVLKEKSDVPAVFAGFLADMRARGTPSIVECLRSDNGTEFTKGEFVALLNHHSIGREHTPVDPPKYDGVAEWRIALVLEAAMASACRPTVCSVACLCRRQGLFGQKRAYTRVMPSTCQRGRVTTRTCCHRLRSCTVGHRSIAPIFHAWFSPCKTGAEI